MPRHPRTHYLSDLVDSPRSRRWEYAGEVGIDTGTLLLADPCNAAAITGPDGDRPAFDTFVGRTVDVDHQGYVPINGLMVASSSQPRLTHAALGVLVQTGAGDGRYRVYIQRSPNLYPNEVAAVLVVFEGPAADGAQP